MLVSVATPDPKEHTVSVRVLFIGEIVGKAGVYCVKTQLPRLKQEKKIDFVIANGDGVTGGFGLGKNHSIYLHKLGVDVITSGECIYYKKDMVPHLDKAPYILRAANYPPGNPGRGWRIYTKEGFKIAVINLLGQSGFNRVHPSNPYTFLPEIVNRIRPETPNIVLDFHAATTAEKSTMFHHANGLVSAVIGTHGRAIAAGETVLSGGTGVLSDAGRTGSLDSVGGMETETEIRKFLTQIPDRGVETWKGLELQGVFLEIEDGKTLQIETLRVPCGTPPQAETSGRDSDEPGGQEE